MLKANEAAVTDEALMPTADIDLTKFCDPNGLRKTLRKPFSIGDYSWATNGHIAVRVPRRVDIAECGDAPSIEKSFWQEFTDFVSVFNSMFYKQPRFFCDRCDGLGKMHKCPTCTCTCWDCDGFGEVEIPSAVTAGPHDIQLKYVRKILRLPNLQIGATEKYVCFRSGNLNGIIMPLVRHHNYPIIGKLF